MWITIFIWFLLPPTSLSPSGDVKPLPPIRYVHRDVRFLFIDGIYATGTEERRYIPAGLFSLECPPDGCQMFSDTVRPFASCLLQFHKILVIFQSEKYLLWNTRTSWSKRVQSFFLLFPFLTDPFILTRTVHFMTSLLIFQTHFFCFCNTCLFWTSTDVGRNIFLLYTGIASKSIRYTRKNRDPVASETTKTLLDGFHLKCAVCKTIRGQLE